MKKILFILLTMIFLVGCVSTGSGNQEFLTSAKIRGAEIRVTDSISDVQKYLGKPDVRAGNQWHYEGKTEGEPTYIIIFQDNTVQNITKVVPQK